MLLKTFFIILAGAGSSLFALIHFWRQSLAVYHVSDALAVQHKAAYLNDLRSREAKGKQPNVILIMVII